MGWLSVVFQDTTSSRFTLRSNWRVRSKTALAVPQPIARFRIFPHPKKTLYARALVFKNKRDMLRYANGPKHFDAISRGITVRVYKKDGRQWTRPVFVEILFNRHRMRTRHIVHEFFHASMAYGRRIHLKFKELNPSNRSDVSDVEEHLAYAHDQMVTQFVDRAYKRGLIK